MKGKPIECCLYNKEFHTQCVGLNASGRRPTWFCHSCKDIPSANYQTPSRQQCKAGSRATTIKSENAQLKKENTELKAAVKSQAELLTQLTESKEAFVGNDTTGDDAENSATLIIGDSIIKDLKDFMLNTFSSPRAQPEVVHFLISKESPYFSSCKSKISASNSL